MILVDSSVWIDYFHNVSNAPSDMLDSLLDKTPLAIGDLILAEVLQGLSSQKEFERTLGMFASMAIFDMCGHAVAVAAAQNYRNLRSRGVTVRKTVDTFIATFCITNGHALLHNDRDFDAFAQHLGLHVVV